MSESKIISWIFLSIALASQTSPSRINGIAKVADAINHAVPTQKELQYALNWLLLNNLILKVSRNVSLSDRGKLLFDEAGVSNKFVSDQWNFLELKINDIKQAD